MQGEEKVKIRLCLGSSCYSRGNEEVLDAVRNFIESNKLEDRVDFRGHLCKGECKKGPNLSIADEDYGNISIENVDEILKKALGIF